MIEVEIGLGQILCGVLLLCSALALGLAGVAPVLVLFDVILGVVTLWHSIGVN